MASKSPKCALSGCSRVQPYDNFVDSLNSCQCSAVQASCNSMVSSLHYQMLFVSGSSIPMLCKAPPMAPDQTPIRTVQPKRANGKDIFALRLPTILLEFPVPVVKRTHLSCFQPS
jgi:hypothetical protein